MTIAQLQVKARGIAPADFILLLEKASGRNRSFLLAHPEYILTPKVRRKVQDFLRRRFKHEPVAYILEKKEFYGRLFRVTRDTLIPRPETELLVEEALKALQSDFCLLGKQVGVVDIGTGSGNIITTLALEHACEKKHLSFFASDRERKAVNVSRRNADRYGVSKKISFFTGDLLEPLLKKNIMRAPSLILAANLPYVSQPLFQKASRDIRDYEPRSALVSKEKGLGHYFRLLRMIKKNLMHKRILLFLEISPEQRILLQKEVRRLFPLAEVSFFRDLAGRSRLAKISLV